MSPSHSAPCRLPRLLRPLALLLAATPALHGETILPVTNGIPRDPVSQLFFQISALKEDVSICGFSVFGTFDPVANDLKPAEYSVLVWEGAPGADEDDPSAWTLVGSEDIEVVSDSLKHVSLEPSVVVPAGQSKRFSIGVVSINAGSDRGLRIEEPILQGIVGNDDILVLSGTASTYLEPDFFGGADVPAAQLYGLVHYAKGFEFCGFPELPVINVPSSLYDGPEPGGVGPLVAGRAYAVSPGTFGWAEVPPGKTLTVEEGAVLLLGDGTTQANRINVKGTATLRGTTVTSVFDTEAGGDFATQLGLTPRPPIKGDFQGVHFQNTSIGSSWVGGELRYGGSNPGLAPLHLNGADVAVDKVTFRDNGTGSGFTVDANEFGTPSLTNSFFLDNDGPPIGGVAFDMLGGFENNYATDNVFGDYLRISGSTTGCSSVGFSKVTGDLKVTPAHYPGAVLVIDGTTCVTSGASLEFAPGVNVKFVPDRNGAIEVENGGDFQANGSAAFPVTFSSLGDDAHFGDTDKDGMDTAAPGDFRWVRYAAGSTGFMNHTQIWYGGDFVPALGLQSSNVSANSVLVADSGQDGVGVQTLNGDLENFVVARSARDGISLPAQDSDGSDPGVVHATVVDNTRDGIASGGPAYGGHVLNTISYGNGGENFGQGLSAANVSNSLGDFAGQSGNLNADPQLGGSFEPSAGSPGIDAGAPSGLLADFFDSNRSASGGVGPLPDMGAAELNGTKLAATPFLAGLSLSLTASSTANPGAPVAFLAGPPLEINFPGLGLVGLNLLSFTPLGLGLEGVEFQFPIPGESSGGGSLIGATFAIQGFVVGLGGTFPTNYVLSEVVSTGS